jgi:TPR repeat protein
MNKPLTFLLSLIFLFLFSGSSVVFGRDLQDGLDAYKRKDYIEAIRLFHLSAEQGNVSAQFNLGHMYEKGKGVPKNYKEAVRLYRLSAEQGDVDAQLKLGVSYGMGRGVLKDYALAHMWWNLSGSNGNKDAAENRDIVEKKMTPQQIQKAQDMARNWKPTKK